jgi:hypothetical protein
MGTDDAVSYLEAIELSEEDLESTRALVDRLYRAYTEFVAEMYDWVLGHQAEELRSAGFFRERVTGEASRPLSARELRDHGTPVRVAANDADLAVVARKSA